MADSRPVVLVVEDDSSILNATVMLLELCEMRVHTAIDGRSAIECLESGIRPDIIICDYQLPGNMNGVEVIRHARELLAREVPTVIMTGDTSAKAIKATKLPFCTVLRKPFKSDALLALIKPGLS